jgi:hypothetical protein
VALIPSASSDLSAHEGHSGHQGLPIGPLANAIVQFGQWRTDPSLDRFGRNPIPDDNVHFLIPKVALIRAGGAVSFMISGVHNMQIFDNGFEPSDIDVTVTTTTTGIPAGVLIINDDRGRICRGPDPSTQSSLDRVETVQLTEPGQYLVICGVKNHFLDPLTNQFEMFGYIRVLP